VWTSVPLISLPAIVPVNSSLSSSDLLLNLIALPLTEPSIGLRPSVPETVVPSVFNVRRWCSGLPKTS